MTPPTSKSGGARTGEIGGPAAGRVSSGTMSALALEIDRDRVADLCRRYGVRRLSVFGSATRPDSFRPDSDIDLLVEFPPDRVVGFALFSLEEDLERLLGRRIDLVTAGFLPSSFRDSVRADAVPLYAAAG